MTFTHSTPRTARKVRRCDCGALIAPGHRYLSHVAAPGGELGYVGWSRYAECASCAERYGRGRGLATSAYMPILYPPFSARVDSAVTAADAPGLVPSQAGGNHRTEAERYANFLRFMRDPDPASALLVAMDTVRVLGAAHDSIAQALGGAAS